MGSGVPRAASTSAHAPGANNQRSGSTGNTAPDGVKVHGVFISPPCPLRNSPRELANTSGLELYRLIPHCLLHDCLRGKRVFDILPIGIEDEIEEVSHGAGGTVVNQHAPFGEFVLGTFSLQQLLHQGDKLFFGERLEWLWRFSHVPKSSPHSVLRTRDCDQAG